MKLSFWATLSRFVPVWRRFRLKGAAENVVADVMAVSCAMTSVPICLPPAVTFSHADTFYLQKWTYLRVFSVHFGG